MGLHNRAPRHSRVYAMKWLFGLVLSAAIAVGSCWTSYSPKFQYMQYAPERSGESHQCRILDSTPFFGTTPRDVDGLKEQLLFLTEFSRFMNSKSLSHLWEFAKSKKVFDWSKKISKSMPGALSLESYERSVSGRQKRASDDELLFDAIMDSLKENRQAGTTAATTSTATPTITTTASPATTTTTATESVDDGDDDDDDDDSGSNAAISIEELIDQFFNNATGLIDNLSQTTDAISDALQNAMGPEMWSQWCAAIWWPYDDEKCRETRCLACSPTIMSASVVCGKTIGRTDDIKCLRDVMGEGHCNYCISEFI